MVRWILAWNQLVDLLLPLVDELLVDIHEMEADIIHVIIALSLLRHSLALAASAITDHKIVIERRSHIEVGNVVDDIDIALLQDDF